MLRRLSTPVVPELFGGRMPPLLLNVGCCTSAGCIVSGHGAGGGSGSALAGVRPVHRRDCSYPPHALAGRSPDPPWPVFFTCLGGEPSSGRLPDFPAGPPLAGALVSAYSADRSLGVLFPSRAGPGLPASPARHPGGRASEYLALAAPPAGGILPPPARGHSPM